MEIRKRNLVKVISFTLAIMISFGVWGVMSGVRLRRANASIRQSNERALIQLGTYLDDITLNLQKSMYVNGGDLLSQITSDLWRSSVSAKECLSEKRPKGWDTDILVILARILTIWIKKTLMASSLILKVPRNPLLK